MNSKLISPDTISATLLDYYKSGGPRMGLDLGWYTLNQYIKMDKGLLVVITGIPSSGKSEWLDQVMLYSIAKHNWHWTVFSPENWPLANHFQKLAEKWTGHPMFADNPTLAMTRSDFETTISELSSHLVFVRPADDEMKIDGIMAILKESVDANATNAFILDPWNECEHTRPSNMSETEYIGQALTRLRNFARLHSATVFVVAHPTKLMKNDDGNYPVPTPYDISGSANWRNKADVCIAVWRDYNENDGLVQIHVQKVRNKNLGQLGNVTLRWDKATGIFSDIKTNDIDDSVEEKRFANGIRSCIRK